METKERDFAKEVEIRVGSIEVLTNPKIPQEVTKVVFATTKGRITYKPKRLVSIFVEGLNVKQSEPCLIADLPDNIKQMGREIALKQYVYVKATFHIWNTMADDEPVTYRYVNGTNMMDSWSLVEKAEEVVEEVKT